MPRPLSWLSRAPAIRRTLLGSPRSHYGRREIERLFELQPRAAQLLLASLPTTAVGTATLVERDALLTLVDTVAAAEDPARTLAGLRARAKVPSRRTLRTLVPRDAEPAEWDRLPGGLTLSPGSVVIEFQTLETLALCLFGLASLLDTRIEEFADRYEIRPAPAPDDGHAEIAQMFAELEQMEAARRTGM